MRCDMCPLSPTAYDDCCPIAYSEYGIEHKDGISGCKHPWNWVKKADEMRALQYQDIGEWYKEQEYNEKNKINMSDKDGLFVKYAIHCIGLDHKKPYIRHGKKWYKPYRNYFNINHENELWQSMTYVGYAREYSEDFFELTDAGIRWLGHILG